MDKTYVIDSEEIDNLQQQIAHLERLIRVFKGKASGLMIAITIVILIQSIIVIWLYVSLT